ncbi:MAG TPA: NAD-dependent epimerase/dehydratase family protein [Candidatus Sulfotelmatobacter sp.]|nr:NAD-dependent epimerase/dehydratase family protein [Candidatus Sulfotelmatobacter sp.]
MRVAVTGASGYVGGAVRRALLARGDSIAALSRRPPANPATGEEWIAGELSEMAALDRLLRGADAVVHAAAWVHHETPDAAAREACFAVNLRGTQRLVDSVARAGHAPRFVYVSTTAVYGERFENRDESEAPAPAGAYGESKLAAERAVLAAHAARSLSAAVLRPAMVYGRGAPGNLARMIRLVRRGAAPLVAGGRNRKSMVHADDLAATILRAIDEPRAAGGVFNVAGEPAPTMREVGEALASGMKRRLIWVPVPGALWSLGAALGHVPTRASGGRYADLGRAMEVFAATTTVRAARVRETLGVSFRDVIEGLGDAART